MSTSGEFMPERVVHNDGSGGLNQYCPDILQDLPSECKLFLQKHQTTTAI